MAVVVDAVDDVADDIDVNVDGNGMKGEETALVSATAASLDVVEGADCASRSF